MVLRAKQSDVVIAGGGLAGLTLAHQLKTSQPDLSITVVEKNRFPVPEGIAKVGESTVEIGSHYLKKTIGLGNHFEEHQLRKFGLRCFFGEQQGDFSEQDELGASQTFGIPTYQIDRGRLENHLARTLQDMDVAVVDGSATSSIEIDDTTKRLYTDTDEGSVAFESRWLFDAAGRQSLVKNQLNLAKPSSHTGNAVWFRLDKVIQVDDWSTNQAWHDRCSPCGKRWLSTNHLMGPGYWVWIIPLASGMTSVGIVCDDQALTDSGITSAKSTVAWLEKNQPRLASAMTGAKFLDFVLIRDYAYDCKQVFSADGWGLVGEAGVFTDPFYSPGSDFIAISNSLITKLVDDSMADKDIRLNAAIYQKIYDSVYSNTLALYDNTYGGFGDRRMMGLKLLWDYSYYWGVLSLLFFTEALGDVTAMQKIAPSIKRAEELHHDTQRAFRLRAKKRLILSTAGVFMDQYQIPCLKYFNEVLKQCDNRAAGDAFDLQGQMQINVRMLERISLYVRDLLDSPSPKPMGEDEMELLGDYRKTILA